MRKLKQNEVLEDHGDWLLIDISTPKFPTATMAVDDNVFRTHLGGRIYAWVPSELSNYIYASYKRKRRTYKFHRDVIGGDMLDHIKHGTMSFVDNRRSNLRQVTSSQNNVNSRFRGNPLTGIRGVYWVENRSKWKAEITYNGKRYYLGVYDNVDFAIGVRQQAERKYFGEFAYNPQQGEVK